ncbi:hypothetical protein M1N61_03250, partial [Peptococcaceae bacterium]|nr:hypothetical protein [Peptococcaceae bacterium]
MVKRIIVLGVLLFVLLAYGGFVWATGSGDPGSASDPLVTRSFVERYISDRLSEIEIDVSQWKIVRVEAGGTVIGFAGTELVLRSGKAVCIDPTANGILNVTDGGNVFDGQAVPRNNMLVFPRSDGRGLKAKTTLYIMYRGKIEISH